MNYALIKDGIVVNVIICSDQDFIDNVMAPQYDEIIPLSKGLNASPGDGFDGKNFTPGQRPEDPVATIDKQAVLGDELTKKVAILLGQDNLTSDQKYQIITNLTPIYALLNSGDLKTALDIVIKLSADPKFIPADVSNLLIQTIKQALSVQ